jgi:cardiolipin synthase A/B
LIGRDTPLAAYCQLLNLPEARVRAFRAVVVERASPTSLPEALRAAAATSQLIGLHRQSVEVAWTFPGASPKAMRTTGAVARELIDSSRESLLVMGYVVTVDVELSGLAARTIRAMSNAATRGCRVTAVLHRNVNRQALMKAWGSAPLPAFFTWPESSDAFAAQHAKVLVADKRDALVTSANLTHHGLSGNLEMGLRVSGTAATQIHEQIFQLIAANELVAWT